LNINCPQCNAPDASIVYVTELTCTICIHCDTLHITETEQYITLGMNATPGYEELSVNGKKLFSVASAMIFIYHNGESIRPNPL